jgi:hypothetical protein
VIQLLVGSIVIAGLLANQSPVLLLVLGAVIIVLGVLRLLGRLPRLTASPFGRRDNPALAGALMILVGGVVVVLGLVR